MPILKRDQTQHIYYELLDGEQKKPCLIFLHEGLGCTAMWKDFPRSLCKETGCPGIVYDRLGYGGSSSLNRLWTIDYLMEYADELSAVISQLIPRTDYYLIGHSDGGSIALIHAAEKPVHLQGIITEAAHVFVEKETLEGIRAAVDAFHSGKLSALFKYHGEKAATLFKIWSDTWLGDRFSSWNIEQVLPLIECKTLVLQGVEDQYGTMAQVISITSQTLHAKSELVEACGHRPHLERPDVVLKLMKEFLVTEMFARPGTL